MCRSMVDIRSTAAEIRRGKKKKKERNYRAKIYMVSLLHRATINMHFEIMLFRNSEGIALESWHKGVTCFLQESGMSPVVDRERMALVQFHCPGSVRRNCWLGDRKGVRPLKNLCRSLPSVLFRNC